MMEEDVFRDAVLCGVWGAGFLLGWIMGKYWYTNRAGF